MAEGLQRELDDSIKRGDQGETIARLLASSIQGEDGSYTLDTLRECVVAASLIHDINALDALPLLLTSGKLGVVELLNLIGENVNARECVIALAEQLERLGSDLSVSDEEDEDEEEEEDTDAEGIVDHGPPLPVSQLTRLLNLYSQVTPRLRKLTGKPASDVVLPLVDNMQAGVRVHGPHANDQNARELIIAVSRNVRTLSAWTETGEDPNEGSKCNLAIFEFVLFTLEACSKGTNIHLSQRAFEAQFPRYALRPDPSAASEVEDVVQTVWEALSQIGFNSSDLLKHPSIGALSLFAHVVQHPMESELFSLLPWFLAAIQTNTSVDEVLAILMTSLGSIKAVGSPDVPTEFIIPLVEVLGPLAGSHPDPSIRHLIFRLLSITLSLTPSPTRLVLLQDLLLGSRSLTPHLSVAAIGLAREAIMEGLSSPDQSKANPFTSPTLLREIGPTIFSLQDPDAFTHCKIPLDDFMDDPEALRLIEGLTLLYLLLQRDVNNRTGIRSPQELERIKQQYLNPLQSQVDFWKQAPEHSDESEHDHNLMQLGILDMWLERTQTAVRSIS